jgi:hypothetical protein
MARSFLAAFRSTDARSLARALIVLMVFGAGFNGLHAGAMAGNTGNPGVICAGIGVSTGNPLGQDSGHGWSCCQFGCLTAPAGMIAAIDIALPAMVWAQVSGGPLRVSPVVIAFEGPASAGPRGPPILV